MPLPITIIIVSYKTPELITNAVKSIRQFYPDIKIIIVDGSPLGSDCYYTTNGMNGGSIKVYNLKKNIGHGKGMVFGIEKCETDYFLLMDSDVEIKKAGAIEEMFKLIQSRDYVYGVGQVIMVDYNGFNSPNGIEYLHPHFALINNKHYMALSPIIHHGSPMINAMIGLNESPCHLINFPVSDYIYHHERGTRKLNYKQRII